MDQQTIETTIRDVMSGLFGVDAAEIGEDTSIETVENWDSLQHVNLVMALEQEFSVTFDVDDALEMTTFSAVCATVAKYTAA